MLDRYQELQSTCRNPESKRRVELQPTPQVAPFLITVRTCQADLERIAQFNADAEEIRRQFVKVATFDEEHKVKDHYKQVVSQRSRLLRGIQKEIDAMAKLVEGEKREKPGMAETRMMESLYGTVVRKFAELLKAAEVTDTAFSQSVKDRIRSQVRMVDSSASEEAVEHLMGHPQAMEQMFQQAIVGVNINVKRMVDEIEERYQDIISLEENIRKMHDMFLHLSVLVHSQIEMLNNIETNVDTAANYVEKGVGALQKAKEHQTRSRYKMFCLLVIVLVVLVVIVVPIITIAKP
jgi:t-SNARE complex subunit (syntaxin)